MNIFQKIINDKRGHAFALKHYSTKCVEDYDYFYHVSDNPNLTLLTPRIPSYSDEYKIYIKNLDTSIEEIELLQFPAVYFSPSAFDCLFAYVTSILSMKNFMSIEQKAFETQVISRR